MGDDDIQISQIINASVYLTLSKEEDTKKGPSVLLYQEMTLKVTARYQSQYELIMFYR